MDQIGDQSGYMGPLSSSVLMGLVGLVLGAWLGGLAAKLLGANERAWTGRGAIIGAALLALIA